PPVFRASRGSGKISFSEKTRRVPSRPTGHSPREPLSPHPDEERDGEGRDDGPANRALGRQRKRIEEPVVEQRGSHRAEEDQHRHGAGAGSVESELVRARGEQGAGAGSARGVAL